MSESASQALLVLATRQLQARWAETRYAWRDQKAAEFDELYLAELSQRVNAALRVLEDLANLLDKVHADCD